MDAVKTLIFLLLALPIFQAGASIEAQAQESHYTKASFKHCKKHSEAGPDDGGAWTVLRCRGRAGYLVNLMNFDDRFYVSVGRTMARASREPAATQRFFPFNDAHETIEWRSRGGKPHAIIQRWFLGVPQTESGDKSKDVELMVVTRLPPGPVCRVAVIDVAANRNYNELARKVADNDARTFRCDADAVRIVGKRGPATELACDENSCNGSGGMERDEDKD